MTKKSKKKPMVGKDLKAPNKKLNPFELHINRKKYDVLGMKSKAERGLPGVSRARALKKRKGTLLQEYKLKDKNNMFWDRRIGERNSAMTAEDKIIARYTAERMKVHSKKSIYNLGDNEELTHRGQSLTEIERFDDPKSDDDDDEEEDGKLNSDFVKDAHFGGGIFKKVDGETRSRKDLIDQLIAESIKRKAEKQKLRQNTLDMTEKLDSDWKELLPLVAAAKKNKLDPEHENKKTDKFANYDVLSKKLKFETRGKPSDRLKSEEEIAKEEREKLTQLEKERIQRMLEGSVTKTIKHRSADDMDDGFELNNEYETVLAYKDGVLNIENEDNNDSDDSNNEIREGYKEHDESKEIERNDEEDTSNDETSNQDNGNENSACDEEDDDDDDDEENDSYSDLKESDESDVEMPISTGDTVKDKNNGKLLFPEKCEDKNNISLKPDDKEVALKTLPFTFNIPKEYEEFEKLLKDHSSEIQAIIVERMIKCHHPSLKEDHKESLDILFTFLLQYIQDCASEESTKVNCFKTLDKLALWLFDLMQWNTQSCCSGMVEVIKEKYKDFLQNRKSYPSLDTLIFLKLVSVLFPTSDFRHPIVTPTVIFMQQILFESQILTSIDLSAGLFITSLLLEYCTLSKRFVPEAINFLYWVVRLAHPKDSISPIRLPLQLKAMESFNLNVADKTRHVECTKLSTEDLIRTNSSEEFKINAVSLALNLLGQFCNFWNEGQSAILIFERFIPLLDSNQFNISLKKNVDEVLEKILQFKKESLKILVWEKKKPKPLRLYEPNIEEVYSFKKHRPMGKKKAERAKLLHKYKREMKGALREIRRDRSFLYKLKYKETIKQDAERKRKVQEILSSAAEQQGELRQMERKKKWL